ncbi:MAG: pyridoxamine 5'-phosphate oxidase family protein [Betaproteobacteria bacterium]|jgi:nitroimidazol reductase NimA-like FMN-containing flavoprotein (pyridoxamine 5'-phosphate oxidase superfamily)
MDLESSRTTLDRYPSRGSHDFATIAAILDEGFFCHVGFVNNGQPFVIPTGYGRDDRVLYIHGSAASRMLTAAGKGIPLCVTVTLVDALVLARSAFHSSVNYRSVVILGTAEPVPDGEKMAALKTITDHIVPGRWENLRPVKQEEIDQTAVLRLDIVEASAKVRTGPPVDDEEDYALPIWAGTLDFPTPAAIPHADKRLPPGVAAPEHVTRYRRVKS